MIMGKKNENENENKSRLFIITSYNNKQINKLKTNTLHQHQHS
jgi:hypothetical protein